MSRSLANAPHRVSTRTSQSMDAAPDVQENTSPDDTTYFRLLAENVQDIIYRVALLPDVHFEYVSPAVTAITGYTPEDHYADPQLGYKLVHPDDRHLLSQTNDPDAAPTESLVMRWITKDGQLIWTEQKNTLITDEDGQAIAIEGIARDITEQKLAEKELRKLKERYHMLTDVAFEGILLHEDGIIQDVNPAFLEMFGYATREELVGKSLLTTLVAPQSRTMVKQNIQNQHVRPYTVMGICKNGSYITVRLEARQLSETLRVVSVRDITEEERIAAMENEYKRLALQVKHDSEHNQLIQRTVAELAHDLRSPLSIISLSKDILLRYFDKLSAEKRQEWLENIGRQLDFAVELLDDTVKLTQGNLNKRTFCPQPTNLAMLCTVNIDEAQAIRPSSHTITFVNDDDPGLINVDEVLVSRILLNLLSNAIKYTPAAGQIQLKLTHDAQHIRLQVADTGIGIAAEDLSRVMEPFYRAKDARTVDGTGLGLGIVQECVKRHRGSIHIDSTPDVGTSVTVTLPHQPES